MIGTDDFAKLRWPTVRAIVFTAYFAGLGGGVLGSQVPGVFRAWWEPVVLGVVFLLTGFAFLWWVRRRARMDGDAWTRARILEGEDA